MLYDILIYIIFFSFCENFIMDTELTLLAFSISCYKLLLDSIKVILSASITGMGCIDGKW